MANINLENWTGAVLQGKLAFEANVLVLRNEYLDFRYVGYFWTNKIENFFEFGIYERRNETLVFNDNYVMIISVSIAFLSL